ncbi:MAG: hypothetical protein ACI4OR_00715 [Alphaproteobacteria bacterium]
MTNYSELNNKYFIDDKAFNCPFCGLRNTTYTILAILEHDISNQKRGKVVFVQCNKCQKISLHFIPHEMNTSRWDIDQFGIVKNYFHGRTAVGMPATISFKNSQNDDSEFDVDIDSQIYHSIPSSFFTMDDRIPKTMRKLFDEAQECRKSNLKTGASACLRKLIYTLLSEQLNKKHKKSQQSIKDLGYNHYSDCIKALKEYHPTLKIFIEPLEDITGITSDQVHEDSWSEMSPQDLDICLESIKDLLYEIYVQPAILQDRRDKICQLRKKASSKGKKYDNK